MVLPLNAFSPLGLDPHVKIVRLCICLVLAIEVGAFLLLRLITVVGKCKLHEEHQEQQENKEEAEKKPEIESGINLKEKKEQQVIIRDPEAENKRKGVVSKFRRARDRLKMVDLISKKGKATKENEKTSPCVQNRQKKTEKQKKKVVFEEQQEVNDLNSETSSDSSSSSSQSESQHPQTPRNMILNPVKTTKLINIRHLRLTSLQFHGSVHLLMAHSFIAMCAALLHFPFGFAGISSLLHLLLILVIIIVSIFVQEGQVTKIIQRVIFSLVFTINLGLFCAAIFGIVRSNPQYYAFAQQSS